MAIWRSVKYTAIYSVLAHTTWALGGKIIPILIPGRLDLRAWSLVPQVHLGQSGRSLRTRPPLTGGGGRPYRPNLSNWLLRPDPNRHSILDAPTPPRSPPGKEYGARQAGFQDGDINLERGMDVRRIPQDGPVGSIVDIAYRYIKKQPSIPNQIPMILRVSPPSGAESPLSGHAQGSP